MDMKRCTRCGQEKPLSEFYQEQKRRDGRCVWCKDCMLIYQRARRPSRTRYPELYDKRWLEEQILHRRRSIAEIASLVGCSIGSVRLARWAYEIPVPPQNFAVECEARDNSRGLDTLSKVR